MQMTHVTASTNPQLNVAHRPMRQEPDIGNDMYPYTDVNICHAFLSYAADT